jgi:hypothetical protein
VLAALIKKHNHYGYKVIERKDDRCTLQFLEDGEPIDDEEEGKVTFTVEDAQAAQLVKQDSNWKKYPRRMCFWRCLTEGIGIYFPDLTLGTPVYTDEEIREVIHVEAQEVDVADADAEDGDAAPILSADRVEQLLKGWEITGLSLDELNVRLGSLGVNAVKSFGVRAGFEGLTAEQAAALEAEFNKLVDAANAAEDVDAEIVDEQPQNGGDS